MTEILKLSSIRLDGDTQLRTETNQNIILSYAQDMLEGDVFPPVIVYHDGTDIWLSDGFHRYFAVEQIEKDAIEAEVRQGTQRDAILYAAEANRKHGIQLTNKDKRRVVTLFLNDAEWSQWSDREIARRCGVSHMFVSTMRKVLTVNGLQSDTRIGADGRTYNTSNIGKSLATVDHEHCEMSDAGYQVVVDTFTRFAQEDSRHEALLAATKERYAFLRMSGRSLNDMCLAMLEQELCEAINAWLGYSYVQPCPCNPDHFVEYLHEDRIYPVVAMRST